MTARLRRTLFATALAGLAAACSSPMPPMRSASPMSFFVTSAGMGKGADLGGLAGADSHCQALASAVGAGDKAWAAYLSASASGGQPAVHARDRIGKGPWRNAKGEIIANDVEELHANNRITKQTALTEKGTVVNGRGDTPNEHDILTGSTPDGRATEMTCGNWTSSGDGVAMVGHSDRTGLDESAAAKSWNSSHGTRGGCGPAALKSTGGAGYFYCFAKN